MDLEQQTEKNGFSSLRKQCNGRLLKKITSLVLFFGQYFAFIPNLQRLNMDV